MVNDESLTTLALLTSIVGVAGLYTATTAPVAGFITVVVAVIAALFAVTTDLSDVSNNLPNLMRSMEENAVSLQAGAGTVAATATVLVPDLYIAFGATLLVIGVVRAFINAQDGFGPIDQAEAIATGVGSAVLFLIGAFPDILLIGATIVLGYFVITLLPNETQQQLIGA